MSHVTVCQEFRTRAMEQTAVSWRATLCGIFRDTLKRKGMHVFWTWAPFFWTCKCFLDLTGFFLELGSQKMWGTFLCVFWTLWGYFLGTCMYLCWTQGIFFSTAKLIVSELGFCFLDPCTCFVDLASIGWGGKLHCYRRSHWAGCFWTLAPSLLEPAYVFLDLAQGEGNLDTEKMHARSCWCRGSSGIETIKT